METLSDLWATHRSTVAFAMVNTLFALSTYVVLAAGFLSFSTVVFAAVGGFLGAQLVVHGYGLPLAFLAAALGGLGMSLIVAAVFLRLNSHWMALASLALVLITRVVVLNAPVLTGGVNGLSLPIPLPMDWLTGVLVVVVIGFYALHHSWFGIASRVLREDPAVAACMGVDLRKVQLIAFAISGAVGGLGGVAMALLLQFISPDTFFLGIAFTMIAATVLGGSYHWFGPVVGAVVYTALPIVMQAAVPQVQDVANGVVLLLIMIFLPRGLIDPRAFRMRQASRHKPA
ncbi:branched-chain amino acid ABC transporter permease [Ramlibacter sp. PS3R-8]|uniref:branched-chain amino acid ABC transporter permease n=1 Tax=Ramlibacter sp. PS3R-8 TaxID=3133437 RepID=UPI0030AF1CC9